MTIRSEEFEAANQRGVERGRKTPTATAARYDRRIGRVVIVLSSGIEVAFRPQDAQGLERARPDDLSEIEISPSGLGTPRVPTVPRSLSGRGLGLCSFRTPKKGFWSGGVTYREALLMFKEAGIYVMEMK